jgi:formylglycine-generating enzyme required for sulfatase activity
MAYDDNTIKDLERDGWQDKEINRGDAVGMVPEKRPPTLRRWPPAAAHIPSDSRLVTTIQALLSVEQHALASDEAALDHDNDAQAAAAQDEAKAEDERRLEAAELERRANEPKQHEAEKEQRRSELEARAREDEQQRQREAGAQRWKIEAGGQHPDQRSRIEARPNRRAARLALAAASLAGFVVIGGVAWLMIPGAPSVLTLEQDFALKPKDTFKECTKCPQMMVVPAGSFIMGSPVDEQGRRDDEGPQHRVLLGKFAVGLFEITFDEWDACVTDGGCNYKPSDQGWGRGRQPVINVSWDDAQVYIAWLARKTGKTYRLLTEAEYEYAARAGTTTSHPWGDGIGWNKANCIQCGSAWGGEQTAPAGSFEPNQFGLYDMAGNVWQWAEDCYNKSYKGAPALGSAWTSGDCSRRVIRGGSWNASPLGLRSANRGEVVRTTRDKAIGFRLARKL